VVKERCQYLQQVFKEIEECYWFELEELGTHGDHVHVFGRYCASHPALLLGKRVISHRYGLLVLPAITAGS
jgi:REP element-mobilizing transposase RayT